MKTLVLFHFYTSEITVTFPSELFHCYSIVFVAFFFEIPLEFQVFFVVRFWRFLAYSDIDLYTVYRGLPNFKWGSSRGKLTCV